MGNENMKAIDMLTWMVKHTINTELVSFVSIFEGFDFQSYFGYDPKDEVPDGKYVYIYGDVVDLSDIDALLVSTHYEPVRIETDEDDHKNGGKTTIYLFKIED